MTRRILLLSSSTCHPIGFLDHAENEIRDFLGALRNDRRIVVFVKLHDPLLAGLALVRRARIGIVEPPSLAAPKGTKCAFAAAPRPGFS